MSNVTIRPATPDEAALLSDLAFRSKAHWDYDPVFLTACRPAMRLTPEYVAKHEVYVLEADGRVIGFYALCDLGNGMIDLDNLFVEPDAIGQGFGKRLWQHAIATARQLGFTTLRIESDPNAEPFYHAMGAQRVGSVPSSVSPDRQLPVLHFSVVVVS
jgi:GNAT superfamily N-acetyltransferase